MNRAKPVTEGPIAANLLRLAWPVTLSFFIYTSYTIVDGIFIGRLGPEALAASGPAQFASWILFAIGEIIGVGATAVVARRVGEGAHREAGHTVAQGITLVVLAGIITFGFASPAVRFLFRAIGTEPEVSRLGVTYLSVLFQGAFFHFTAVFLESALRAAGDTRTPMLITGGGLLLNIVLDPLLIFGWGPFPELGIRGASVATVISWAITAFIFFAHFRSSRTVLPVRFRSMFRPEPVLWAKIIRIGAPVSAITVLFSMVYLFLSAFLARFGTVPVAVVSVGNRLEGITYLIAHGFSIAVSTMVGQNLGAGRPERAEGAAWLGSWLAAAFAAGVMAAFWLFPREIFSAFSTDPEVIKEGAKFLRIVAICQCLMAVEVVMYGAFSGAGDTMPATVISTTLNGGRIPAAYFVAVVLGYGPVGIWWVISLSCLLRGLILALWFRRNRWMEKEV